MLRGVNRRGLALAVHGLQERAMNDELHELRNAGYKPVLAGPLPFSLEESPPPGLFYQL